jgi:hypothetical protein
LVSQQIKDKIWNFEYTDCAQLIRQNGQYYNNIEQKQTIVLENGKLVISNRSSVSPRHICIIVKNKNKNYYYYFPILPKFTIRNVNRICLYTEPQGGRRTRDSVICCEASFAVQHTYIADLLGRCNTYRTT